MEIPDKLGEFINEARPRLPPLHDLDEALGLDSLSMMKWVSFLEGEIGYPVEDDVLTSQKFHGLRSIGQMLQGKAAKL